MTQCRSGQLRDNLLFFFFDIEAQRGGGTGVEAFEDVQRAADLLPEEEQAEEPKASVTDLVKDLYALREESDAKACVLRPLSRIQK